MGRSHPNSYPAIETWVSRRIESAATLIQLPELETATTRMQTLELELHAGWNQPLVLIRVPEIDISVGILDFNKYNYVYLFAFDNF